MTEDQQRAINEAWSAVGDIDSEIVRLTVEQADLRKRADAIQHTIAARQRLRKATVTSLRLAEGKEQP